jgi:hypothetical protein
MFRWIQDHGVEAMIIAYAAASAISALPAPKPTSSPFYAWTYAVAHDILQIAAANWNKFGEGIKTLSKS